MPKLYIIGTPLGNLEDISFRAIRILKEAKIIFTEDKRVSLKIINKFDLGKKELISFNENNSLRKLDVAIDLIEKNDMCALISDAGMPVISDPGFPLINKCWENNIEIDVIPGPSAPITALAASGFPASKFLFLGFIPRDKNRRRLLKELKDFEHVIVFFESPYRIVKTLDDIYNIMGDKHIFIGREMTKLHQEYIRGNIKEIIEKLKNIENIRGEITVVVSGK